MKYSLIYHRSIVNELMNMVNICNVKFIFIYFFSSFALIIHVTVMKNYLLLNKINL